MIGIYAIQNLKDGQYYVGQSRDVESRLQQHLNSLRNNTHINKSMQEGFNAVGVDNFSFSPVQELDNANELLKRERYFILEFDSIDNGYNITIPRLPPEHGGSSITNINIKIDDTLLDKFEDRIKENNKDVLVNKLNKSCVIRTMIGEYIKKKIR